MQIIRYHMKIQRQVSYSVDFEEPASVLTARYSEMWSWDLDIVTSAGSRWHLTSRESPNKLCTGRPSGYEGQAVCASFLATQSRYWACLRAARGCAESSEQPTLLENSSVKHIWFLTCSVLWRSKPCISSDRKCLCCCHALQVASSKKLFCFGEGSCSSRGNSVQMCPKLNHFFSHRLAFTFIHAQGDVKPYSEPKLVLGVIAFWTLQDQHPGCHFTASDQQRCHVLSHGCWEVAPRSHNPDTHSHFINLWTLFQSNEVRKPNGFFFFHKWKFYSKFLKIYRAVEEHETLECVVAKRAQMIMICRKLKENNILFSEEIIH